MAINQLSTANTFQEWLTTTSELISLANTLVSSQNNESFLMNSHIEIAGSNSSLNVRSAGAINVLYANTANIANISLQNGNIELGGNIAAVNVTTTLKVGGDTVISGNLTVSGNITLDEIGFDDLQVHGSANVANNMVVGKDLTVSGVTTLAGDLAVGNLSVSGTFTGAANTAIYAAIAAIPDQALALAIALG